MPEPTVCAIMLTANRPEMARRAIECFRAQTYQAKWLFILDSVDPSMKAVFGIGLIDHVWINRELYGGCETIGQLRNTAIREASECFSADILIHFDDDDWSHPNRIAEQVALLQSSGADVVGYNEMLFWREPVTCGDTDGEAWLYTQPRRDYALGTSLCYWRSVWERKPFEATSVGEDVRFCTGLKVVGVSSIIGLPRMIARIHAGNTSSAYRPEAMRAASEWQRVPAWDEYCGLVMKR